MLSGSSRCVRVYRYGGLRLQALLTHPIPLPLGQFYACLMPIAAKCNLKGALKTLLTDAIADQLQLLAVPNAAI
jgi:hypothetical protein